MTWAVGARRDILGAEGFPWALEAVQPNHKPNAMNLKALEENSPLSRGGAAFDT